MAQISKTIYGFVLKEAGMRQILDLFRADALLSAEKTLAEMGEAPVEDVANVAFQYSKGIAEAAVETNGLSMFVGGIQSRTTSGGTIQGSNFGQLSESFLDGLDALEGYSLDLMVSRWSLKLGVTNSSVKVDLSLSYALDYSSATDDELLGMLGKIEEIILQNPIPVVEQRPFRVFIGHGGDNKWATVKALLESAGYTVEAFESESRAAYGTLETVKLMITSSTVAVIVMTGTDEQADGTMRARENVIHELGFAQGLLGITNTIMLVEANVRAPSNMAGRGEIRFAVGDIGSTITELKNAIELRKNAHENSQRS